MGTSVVVAHDCRYSNADRKGCGMVFITVCTRAGTVLVPRPAAGTYNPRVLPLVRRPGGRGDRRGGRLEPPGDLSKTCELTGTATAVIEPHPGRHGVGTVRMGLGVFVG